RPFHLRVRLCRGRLRKEFAFRCAVRLPAQTLLAQAAGDGREGDAGERVARSGPRAGSDPHTVTGWRTRFSAPKTRRYRSISAGSPVAFSGLSESFTAGRPLASVTLHTMEIAFNRSISRGAQSSKSLVRLVPQPKAIRTRPSKWR